MKTAYYNISFGYLQVEYENEMLYRLSIVQEVPEHNQTSAFSNKVFRQIKEYLDGKRKIFDIKYVLKGTDFQLQVWHELEKIAYGDTLCYADIAKNIGNLRACRAVGMACNANPLWVIVPCHRVIGKNGHLTGYAKGLSLKQKLLQLEQHNL